MAAANTLSRERNNNAAPKKIKYFFDRLVGKLSCPFGFRCYLDSNDFAVANISPRKVRHVLVLHTNSF